MITKRKPEAKTLVEKRVSDIVFTNTDKNIYVIENIIQRVLVWGFACCETLWNDIYECIRKNIENTEENSHFYIEKNYDVAYCLLGNIEHSTIDECNQKYLTPLDGGVYKSLVDGSQRGRLVTFISMAFLYLLWRNDGREFMDLSAFRTKTNSFKLIELGINDLDNFYKYLETNPIKVIDKKIKSLEKLEGRFNKEDEERNYFETFSLFVRFIERDIIGKYDLNESFKIFINNTYFYEEFVEPEYKFERFVDRNKKGTPMSDEAIYPKYIINQFDNDDKEEIYNVFKKFKERAEYAEKSSKIDKTPNTFRATKGNLHAVLFIMIETLKIKLAEEKLKNPDFDINLNKVFCSSFRLNNIDYGIEKCFSKGFVFTSVEKTIEYFEECYNFADFIIKETFSRHSNIYEDCYYLRDFGSQNLLWWFFYKPCYVASKIADNELYKFIKKAYYIIYSFYVVHRCCDTNVQNTINLIEQISCETIMNTQPRDIFIRQTKNKILKYINNAGGFEGLRSLIHSLSYGVDKQRSAIEYIFKAMEYDFCEKFSLPTDSFYNLWVKNGKNYKYNLDHWYPQNLFKNKENDLDYQHIGNLVLLEDSLNKSKQDDVSVNSDYYTQSRYCQTLLLDKNKRGAFTNDQIDKISSCNFERFSTDEVNNPTLENIRKRGDTYEKYFINFIQEFLIY